MKSTLAPHQNDIDQNGALPPSGQRRTLNRRSPAPLALEPRVMFDGATADAAVMAARAAVAEVPADLSADRAVRQDAQVAAAVQAPAPARHEIVFVEDNVSDFQKLVAAVPSGTEVVVLDHTRDGLQQMVEALDGHAPVDAIHLVTHGSVGQIELGTSVLDGATLDSHAGALAQLGGKLSEGGDLLIYGCDVAANVDGQALIERIGQLTGADMAASTDLSGSSAYGNWTLEAHSGAVETASIELDRAGWSGELVTDTVYNANWQMLTFSNVTSISGSGTGKTGGDVMRFNNVITLNGQVIDAVVTTAVSGTGIDTYDSPSVPSGTASYFQPSLRTTVTGGNATFTISFFKGGSYTGAGTGTAVTLQNVVVNSYDIDSTGGADRQFQSFKGFARYELSNDTYLVPTVQADGSVTFLYTTNSPQNNNPNNLQSLVAADPYRVRVYYDSMSTFQVNAGVAGTTGIAYFAFDFSIGPDWTGPKTMTGNPAPILSYSRTSFAEASANDGSIALTSTITLANGSFTGSNGQELLGVNFSNVPAGLSPHIVRTSATTAELSFTGSATAHANANDIGNLGVSFGNAAFASGNAGAVTGATRADLAIDFADPESIAPVVAANQAFTYAENRASGTVLGTVAASDNIGVTGFRFAATGSDPSLSADGYFRIAGDGRVSLTDAGAAAGAPSNDYEKTPNSFTHAVQARDAAGNWSTAVNLVLKVSNLDEQAPLFTSGATAHVLENQAVLYTASANDTVDYTDKVVSYSLKTGTGDATLLRIDGTSGVVRLDTGTLDAGLKSSYAFTVIASDATGNTREQAVTVTVDPVNRAPVAAADSITTAEDTAYTSTLPAATDADGDTVSYAKASGPQHGTVLVGANGAYTYTPSANYNGNDSFSYTVSDGNGGSNTYTVSVNVTAVNDAPVGAGDSITTAEDTVFTGTLPTATDVEGDSLSYSKASDPQNGTVQVGTNGSYTYTPNANYNGTDSFTYTVSDGKGGSNTYTVSVNVTTVNDAPVAGADSITTAEDTVVTGMLPAATDADGDTVSYVKASDPQNGTVQVGTNGRYTYTPSANYNGSDSFSYTVSDGKGGSNTYTVSVNVTPVNDAPVGAGDIIVTTEDASYTGTLPTATDADGDTVSYAKASDPQHGTVQVGINGSYTYTPSTNYNGTDSFTYTVSDGKGGSNTYTISVNVTPVNDAPVAAADSITTAEDTAFIGTLPAATDIDGDSVSYSKATDPQHGIVQVGTNGAYTYTPSANYNGNDSFTYTVSDGKGGSNTYTVSVNVTPVNDAPVAGADSITTAEDMAFTGTLPAATDVDGDTVSYSKATEPQHGIVQFGANGAYTYTPNANYNGNDSFKYTVSDGKGGSNTYTVSVNVTPVNDAPVAAADSITTAEDTAFTGTLPAATDVDGDTVSYSKATEPQHGIVQVDANGAYTYTPTANYNGTDSFNYTVSDGKGGSNTYTVSVNVTPVNDAPVAAADSITTAEDTAFTGTLPAATDVDGDTVSYSKATDPQHGTVQVGANGAYTYTPSVNYNGNDSFTYTVSDGKGGSNTYTVSVNITPVNDAPVGTNDSIVTAEDKSYIGTLPAATDVDGDKVSYTKASDPQHGTVQVGTNGSYTYTPTANYNGTDSFSYTVSDGKGGSNTYTVSVNVTPVNDAPVGTNDSIATAEDKAYTGTLPSATDIDGDNISYAKATDPQHGTVQVGTNGSYTYTPSANYNGSDSFTYTVSDGNGGSNTYTVSVNVTPVNDAPVAHGGAAASGIVGEALVPVELPAFTDIDGPALGYTATLADGKPLPSWLVFDPATLRITGTPPEGSTGTWTVLVTGSDGALSDSAKVVIDVANPALPGQSLAISSMTKDTGTSPTDFVTNDGSAGRTVSGSIGAPLGRNETVQVSFDGGATWNAATVSGSSWTAVDANAHAGNWTIEARVANTAAGLNGPATAREVVLDTSVPTAPTVDDVVTTSTTPVLSGSATVGSGETLLVTVNGAAYEVSAQGGRWTLDLASAKPVSGNAAPLTVGQNYDVTATVSDLAGNTRSGANSGTLAVSPPAAVQDTPPAAPAAVPAPAPEIVQAPAPVVEAAPVAQAVDSRVNSDSAAPGSLAAGDTVLLGSGQGTRSSEQMPSLDLRGAELSDVYTRTEGFRTVVAKAEEPALVLFQGVPDQYADAGTRLSLSVPADAFAHTQPKAIVRLTAILQDGKPLPAWVEFNGQTGQFTGEVPKGLKGELKIKLVARDLEGREATALFRINVGQNRNTSGTPQADAKAAPAGKPGLSAQLRAGGRALARRG